LFSEHAVDARSPNAEQAGDRRRAEFLIVVQTPNFVGVDGRFATFVDAAHLGGSDTFELPLAAQIGLEFGEYAEHVEEGFAGRGAGVDRLLGRLERNALGLQLLHDVLQVL
jgi:hypothetical protein